MNLVMSSPLDDPAEWRRVTVVPALPEKYIAFSRPLTVRRIKLKPPLLGHV